MKSVEKELCEKGAACLDDLGGKGWVVAYQACRKVTASLGKMLAKRMGWAAIPIGIPRDKRSLFIEKRRIEELREASGVVIVDNANQNGETLRMMATVLKQEGVREIKAFYVINGMSEAREK